MQTDVHTYIHACTFTDLHTYIQTNKIKTYIYAHLLTYMTRLSSEPIHMYFFVYDLVHSEALYIIHVLQARCPSTTIRE